MLDMPGCIISNPLFLWEGGPFNIQAIVRAP